VAAVGNSRYHVVSVPLQLDEATIGFLQLGTALDAGYARELAELSRGHAAIVEATQTLTPRMFAAARYDEQWTKWQSVPDLANREESYRRVETAVGFRLLPEVTLRASYMTREGYVVGLRDDQFLASIVYAKKIF
jgi:hypothetical protein